MPELPEVETIVRQLNCNIINKEIVKVDIYDSNIIDPKIKNIISTKIKKVFRRAKSIIFELNDGEFLLTHLRMTGHFYYVNKNDNSDRYKQFIVAKLKFSDDSFLTHNSIRKFGGIKLLNKEELNNYFSKLGPEPLEISSDEFKIILSKKKNVNIKTAIMDQKVIVGIGNIYAQEALYYSAISPLRKVNSLTFLEINSLYGNIQEILRKAIKYNGSTVDNYSNLTGRGEFQNFLKVYNKSKCYKGHQVKKINIGGRGTSYCPVCQK